MEIRNDRYVVTFCAKGGEIQSFSDTKTNIQYMWQGDEKYWTGKNPTLFPQISNTYTKDYEIKGQKYAMPNHGFIRSNVLEYEQLSDTSAKFTFKSNEDTKKMYPFDFEYELIYTLNNDTLEMVYHIKNSGNEVMPFSFGLHPGFNAPLCEGEHFEDYRLVFEKEEHCKQLFFDTQSRYPYTLEDITIKEWKCNWQEMEEIATLVYVGCESKTAQLIGPQNHGVEISIEGYPYFAVWNPGYDAPFLCLEPWYGHGDFSKLDVAFEDREGTMKLAPNEVFTTSYTIRVF